MCETETTSNTYIMEYQRGETWKRTETVFEAIMTQIKKKNSLPRHTTFKLPKIRDKVEEN